MHFIFFYIINSILNGSKKTDLIYTKKVLTLDYNAYEKLCNDYITRGRLWHNMGRTTHG
jgi:hypothetical protein